MKQPTSDYMTNNGIHIHLNYWYAILVFGILALTILISMLIGIYHGYTFRDNQIKKQIDAL